jgi:hypothetical protein
VDNGPSAAESKCLAKVYKALGWDASRMYADLHAGKSTAPESDRQTGHQGTTLDADRLDELRAETRELRTTLGAIYAENMDRSVAYEVNPAREPAKGGPQQLALDAIHQKLVTRLLEKPLWARTEVAAISTSLHLLLDGALEAINESTLRLWDDILLEGADPIEVNPELVRRLS